MKPTIGISVDGSSRGNPGPSNFRATDIATGAEVFKVDIGDSTNNIAEFIGLVKAINYAIKNNLPVIYCDSVTAISWVRNKKAKTSLTKTKKTEYSLDLVDKAEKYLNGLNVDYMSLIQKWDTKKWGENPADFGFK